MKAADRSGAAVAVIVGERELAEGVVGLRRLRGDITEGDGAQERVARTDLLAELRAVLPEPATRAAADRVAAAHLPEAEPS